MYFNFDDNKENNQFKFELLGLSRLPGSKEYRFYFL